MPAGWEDRLLAETAREVAYPPTPEMRPRVLAAIAERAPAAGRNRARRLRVVYAAAAVLLLAVVLTLAVEPARTAVAEFFGLVEGATIEILPTPTPSVAATAEANTSSTAEAGTSSTPVPVTPATPEPPRLIPKDMADATTLAAATESLGFEPALPPGQGEPRAVYVLRRPPAVVVLEYADFDLWQSRSGGIYIGKGVFGDSLVDTPTINGEPSYWIEGGRHFMRFLDEDGETIAGTERTVDRNTLIWRGAETFYRIETDLPEAEAVAIAESLP
jgi:hypothetical protein